MNQIWIKWTYYFSLYIGETLKKIKTEKNFFLYKIIYLIYLYTMVSKVNSLWLKAQRGGRKLDKKWENVRKADRTVSCKTSEKPWWAQP